MAATGLLPAALQSSLQQIVQRTNASNGGIRVILLSTTEGVPLGRIYADTSVPLNEDVLSSIESTWSVLLLLEVLVPYYAKLTEDQ